MRSQGLLALALLISMVTSAQADHPKSADEVVGEVRRVTEQYQDIARARADGFVQVSGMEARHGYHFVNVQVQLVAAASGALDLARPPVLLYVEREGVWQLVGVEYVLPARPSVDPFPGAEWHQHEASCHYRDDREQPAPRAAACPPRLDRSWFPCGTRVNTRCNLLTTYGN